MVVVVIFGGKIRLIVKLADLLGSVFEVAVTTAVLATVTLAGALYVTVVAELCPVNEPSPLVSAQVTPALLGSLLVVAVINCVTPWSKLSGLAGDSATVMAGLIVMLRLPLGTE